MTTINNARTPWQEIRRVGVAWHGHESGGQIYSRLNNQLITLPTGVAYNRTSTGETRLIDFGLPSVDTTQSEADAGMMWWEKGVFSGHDRVLNPVRGSSADSIFLRLTAWLYRCIDGTVYALNYVDTERKIFASIVTAPSHDVPENPTGGTVVCDLSALVFPASYTSGNILPHFVNFSPSGSAAAVHFVVASAGSISTEAIAEVSVSGGSTSAVPDVALTRFRTSDGALTDQNADGLVYPRSIISIPTGVGDVNVDGSPPGGWHFWPGLVEDQQPSRNGYIGWNGTWLEVYRKIHTVDYNTQGSAVDIGVTAELQLNFTSTLSVLPDNSWRLDFSIVGRNTSYLSSGGLREKYYEHTYEYGPCWEMQWYDYGFPGPLNENFYGAACQESRLGNIVIASINSVQFDASGLYLTTPVDVRGVAGAKSVTCSGTSLGSLDPHEIAVDPVIGSFDASISRYF